MSTSAPTQSAHTHLAALIEARIGAVVNTENASTPYLIMTIFGDNVIPHGGEIWLGSLVTLLAPLKVSERSVRTAVFRLTKDGWLESARQGRKSYYRALHLDEISENEARIYHPQPVWDKQWRILVGTPAPKANAQRDRLRKYLLQQGFCAISSTVFGHPTCSIALINDALERFGLQEEFVVLRSCLAEDQGMDIPMDIQSVGRILHRCEIDDLARAYQGFVDTYREIGALIDYQSVDSGALSDGQCFLLASLLINDYRRVIWHDKIGSQQIFDKDWVGHQAQRLLAHIYCEIEERSRRHFRVLSHNQQGELPPFAPQYRKRLKHWL